MEIIEPDAISYSFNTVGWSLVFAFLVLCCIVATALAIKHYVANAYRRKGIEFVKSSNSFEDINYQLKLNALKLWKRDDVASLQGVDWFSFLNNTMKNCYSKEKYFSQFSEAVYSNVEDPTLLQEYKEFSSIWFKKHKK